MASFTLIHWSASAALRHNWVNAALWAAVIRRRRELPAEGVKSGHRRLQWRSGAERGLNMRDSGL